MAWLDRGGHHAVHANITPPRARPVAKTRLQRQYPPNWITYDRRDTIRLAPTLA